MASRLSTPASARRFIYLTDYQSLYVGDVDLIRDGDPGDGESAHIPGYYGQ